MKQNAVKNYLSSRTPDQINSAFLGYLCNLEQTASVAPEIAAGIVSELEAQRSHLKLIASENYCSLATQMTMGNLLTDKYAEGYPGHRFYAGCENIDDIEGFAAEQAKKLFGCEHAYVQPHSGADANLIAYWAILSAKIEAAELEKIGETNLNKLNNEQWAELRAKLGNQRLLGLDYYSGGHLTHGYRYNVSARMFDVHSYTVSKETGVLDYDAIEKQAQEVKPLILLAGYSAYPRAIDFKRMRQIADSVGAVLMVDIAHFAGLVAGRVFEDDFNPVAHAHVVTTTTHKTLRGPRGALVMCTSEFAEYVDKGCPLVIGGPLPHVMAAKAIAFSEANRPEFRDYAKKVVANSRAMAAECAALGLNVLTGGTDNHLFLVNVTNFDLTGRQAESALRECGITLNRNSLPFDVNGPWYTSGLRLGTPAITTLGMGEAEMKEIAAIVHLVLKNTKPLADEKQPNGMSKAKYEVDAAARDEAIKRVHSLLDRFPVYPELDLNYMKEYFGK